MKLDTAEWGRWSIGNCARNWNLSQWTNGICTNQNPSLRRMKFSGILRYSQFILSRPDERKQAKFNKKRNLSYSGLCPFQRTTEWKSKKVKKKKKKKRERIIQTWQRTKKAENLRMTVIPIVNEALRKVTKSLERELKDLIIGGRKSPSRQQLC